MNLPADFLSPRIYVGTVIGLTVFFCLMTTVKIEEKPDEKVAGPKYRTFLNVYNLPLFLSFFIFGIAMDCNGDPVKFRTQLMSACFMIVLQMTLYYSILILLHPYLRRKIHSRTCAGLWIMPEVLCIFVQTYESNPIYWDTSPIQLALPPAVVQIAWKVWMTGFWIFLLWKIIEHNRFAEKLELTGRKVTDPAVLDIWEQEQKSTGEFPLLQYTPRISPMLHTPLSIGILKSNTILYLPEKEYSAEELKYIFRHEIIHIQRRDGTSKFFLVFCTALCWFNPIMWAAMARTAEDLELSCDDAVLCNVDQQARHQYAHLLLRTAGDARGFTTCLASTASVLRNRMKNVISPEEKVSGALIAAIAAFLLVSTFGFVSLEI